MEDITPQTSLASSSQDEAVENIRGAKVFDTTPDIFKQNREALKPELEKMGLPGEATPIVARSIAESSEHAAAIAPDASKFSFIETHFGNLANAVKRKLGPERETADLGWKKLTDSENFSEDDDIRLRALKMGAKNNFGYTDYGPVGAWEGLADDVAATVADLPFMVNRNKGTMAAITAATVGATAVTGAVVGGVPTGGVGAPAGALTGAAIGVVPGLGYGFMGGMLKDNYQSTAGTVYNTLSDATDAQGAPLNINEDTKRSLAHGVGLVGGVLQVAADKLLIKKVPILNKYLGSEGVTQLVTDPERSAVRDALIRIGKAVGSGSATMGTATGLQEAATIVGEEIGNTYKNGETNFVQGLVNAANKISSKEGAERVGKSFVSGAATGAVMAGVPQAAGELIGARGEPGRITVENPSEPPAIPLAPGDEPPQLPSGPHQQMLDILNLQDTVDANSHTFKNTELYKKDPDLAREVRRKIVEEKGPGKVYFEKEDLQKIAKDDASGARLRNSIDKTGVLAGKYNGPLSMDAHKFLDLHDDYPELSDYVKLNPDGPSPNDARAWTEAHQAAEEKRAEIKAKLGVGEKSPEERAYNLKVTPEVSDEHLSEKLGSKEVAQAYLDRLDVNQEAEKENPEQLAKIQVMRERVQKLKEQLPDDKTAKDILKQALETKAPDREINSPEEYVNRPILSDTLKEALPEKEVQILEENQRKARQHVADSIMDSAVYEMNKVTDINEQINNEIQKQVETEKIKNDPNVAIVEKFTRPPGADLSFNPIERYKSENELTAAHAKKGYSPFAIDFRTLDENQQKKYRDNALMKKNKVFVKGGISPDDAASLLGINGGERLLKILATTPSREEIIKAGVEQRKMENRQKAIDSTDLNETALVKALNNKSLNDLNEMRVLVERANLAATKRGIKRMALPLPKIEEISKEAKLAVSQMKVGELNPNQFRMGERKSQRLAVENALKQDYETAAIHKQAEALNTQLVKEASIATAKVNRVQRLARTFERPETIKILRDAASKDFNPLDAANELLDFFNLNPSKKGQSKADAFAKWRDAQIKAGNDNFEIPEKFADQRQSINDMTVEEVLTVGDRLKSILHQAKRKNKLYLEFGDPAKELQHIDVLAGQIEADALRHPDYKEDRGVNKQGSISAGEKFLNTLGSLNSSLRNMEHLFVQADPEMKVNGLLNREITAKLKGDGKFGDKGEAGKARDLIHVGKQFEKIVEDFGKKDWMKLRNTEVDIPEWKDNAKLNYGKLTKGNLFMLLMNMGNEGNMDGLSGNGTDRVTVNQVLRRELGKEHYLAAQRIGDMFEQFRERVFDLHEKVTGIRPEKVEPTPLVAPDGTVMPGWYFPKMFDSQMNGEKLASKFSDAIKIVNGEMKVDLSDHFYTDDMTQHNHTFKRVGSDQPLNLNMDVIDMAFENITHDLNFREPIADALKILLHPKVIKSLESTLGKSNYNVIINTAIRAAGSVQMENKALYNSSKPIEQLLARFRGGFANGAIVFNPSSILIQPSSAILAVRRMGLSGVPHFANVVGQMIAHLPSLGKFYEIAGEINPSIKRAMEGLSDNTRGSLSESLPEESKFKSLAPVTKPLEYIRDKVSHVGFSILEHVDVLQKVVFALSSYSQFIAGDSPGFTKDQVLKMTPEERDHAAKTYASRLAGQTLTTGSEIDRAEVQKNFKTTAMFFNDPRNVLNQIMREGTAIRYKVKDANKSMREGDYVKGAKLYGGAGAAAGLGILTLAALRGYEDTVRGRPTPWNNPNDPSYDPTQDPEFGSKLLKYIAFSPVDLTLSSIPGIRDAYFALENDNYRLNKDVQSIPVKTLTDVKNTVELAMSYMGQIENDNATNRAHVQSSLYTLSYLTGGIPANALTKLYYKLKDWDPSEHFGPDTAKAYSEKLDEIQSKYADKVPPEVMKSLEDIRAQIAPTDESKARITTMNKESMDATKEKIKQIESKGLWYAKNPNSSAAGLYQFTADTWDNIMEEAPDLHLTEEGRTSSDTEEQEKAMDWSMKENAVKLLTNGIEVNAENLYGAHFLGVDKAVQVLNSKGDTKLKTLLSNEEMEANNFRNGMKVKDFKSWLKKKIDSVEDKTDIPQG